MIEVSWTAVDTADSYKVSWWPKGGGVTASDETPQMMYTISGLMNDTTYEVEVMAMRGDDVGPASETKEATPTAAPAPTPDPEPMPPAAPEGLNADSGDAMVELSWLAVTGATKYMVEWRTSAQSYGDPMRQQSIMNPTVTAGRVSTEIEELSNDTEYMFIVRAGNDDGYSGPSMEVTAMPVGQEVLVVRGQPTNVKLTPQGRNAIKVSWEFDGEGDGATAFRFDVGWTDAGGMRFSSNLAPQTVREVPGRRESKELRPGRLVCQRRVPDCSSCGPLRRERCRMGAYRSGLELSISRRPRAHSG